MVLENKTLARKLGNCRRYSKEQFQKLLKNYQRRKGMYENFGETTVDKCLEYIHKQNLDDYITYSQYQDWIVDDLKALQSELIDELSGHLFSNDYLNFEEAQEIVYNYQFFADFEGLDW